MAESIKRWNNSRPLRTAVAAEADHRIANSLSVIASLVRVQASKGRGGAESATFLKEIAERIDTVAKLHHHVARSQSGTVRLDAYLEEICQRLNAALAQSATSFSIACPPAIIVPFNVAMPLGLITAELFSNSLKYAHPAGLPVKIGLVCAQAAPHEVTFVFEDDGVGFPEDFDAANDGNLGMRFIRMLSDQLGGTPNWSSDPLGIRFEMTAILTSVDQTGAAAPDAVSLSDAPPLHG